MIEEKLGNVTNTVEELKNIINKFETNEGEIIPGFEEEVELIQPYFKEDSFFREAVKKNIKNLKSKYQGEDLERALAFIKAEKTRSYIIQLANESLGFREIADNNFSKYSIIAYRKENVIRGENIREKTNFMNPFFVLTTKKGFKEVNNKFRQAIILEAQEILESIRKNGTYDENNLNIELNDNESQLSIKLKLACRNLKR